jgi:hypothetical protein
MARTYIHTPYIKPYVFQDIVAKVSQALSTDDDLPNIPRVSYKYGSWLEILDQLSIDSNSPTHKSVKYPLVCLIYDIQENYIDAVTDSIRVDILICTNTTPTMKLANRYSTNFESILNPIYAELKSQIARSRSFLGYNQKFRHTKIDKPHLGQQSAEGPTAYKLPDFLDGILLQGIELRVNQSQCVQCVPKYLIDSLDLITFASTDDTLNKVFELDFTATIPTNTHTLYLDGVEQLGYTINMPYGLSYGALSDGLHRVVCQSDTGAQCEALFTTLSGSTTQVLNSVSIDLTYDLPCGQTPINTFDYEGSINTTGYVIQNQSLNDGTSEVVNNANANIEANGTIDALQNTYTWYLRTSDNDIITQKTILTIKNNL